MAETDVPSGKDPASGAVAWVAGRLHWHDEADRRRGLARVQRRLGPGRWFSAEMPDDETEIAWPAAIGEPFPPAADGLDVVGPRVSPRVLAADLNGFAAPGPYATVLALTTARAVTLLSGEAEVGSPLDVATELATVWCSLIPRGTVRREVLTAGAAWLERRAQAATDAAGATGAAAGLESPPRRPIVLEPGPRDQALAEAGRALEAVCTSGELVQLCSRAVHIHKVRLVPRAGSADVAAELRAEARVWAAIADR
jgi:hypothetical protein